MLRVIETTEGMNGYPKNIGKAVIGFKSFEEAEEFAKEHNSEVVELRRKAGQYFWNSYGTAYSEYHLSSELYGDDYETAVDAYEWWQSASESIDVKSYADPIDLKFHIEKLEEIYSEIYSLGENEQLLIHKNYDYCHYEVIPIEATEFEYDSCYFAIGVIVPNDYEL